MIVTRVSCCCFIALTLLALSNAFIHAPLPIVKTSNVVVSSRTSTMNRLSMMVTKTTDDVTTTKKSAGSAAAASTSEMIDSAAEVLNKLKSAAKDINVADLQDDANAVLEGVKGSLSEGEFGKRGEALLAAQLTLLLFVLIGDIPFVGGIIDFAAGPGLLIAGLGLSAASILQLGGNFSPLMPPREGALLRTTGVYSFCRHPSYTGLIMFGLGLGFFTDSFIRVALSLVLAYVLDKKASEEEKLLAEKFPAYSTYKEEVAKFVPKLY